ncbi:unnamed protein product [Allacma fusca]|nr:unnamed protein product [Allacma fusca]
MFINSYVPCQKDDQIDCTPVEEASLGNFYQVVLAFASGGCAILGVVGVLLLTFIIFLKHSSKREEFVQRHIPRESQVNC